MTKESLAKTIERLRKSKGWSQQKLADEAGVSYHTVFRAESGTVPTTQNLQKLAKALDSTETDLLGGKLTKPKAKELDSEMRQAIEMATKEAIQQTLAQQASPPPPKSEEETHEQAYFRMLKEYEKLAKERMPERDFFKMLRFFLEDFPEIAIGQIGFGKILDRPASAESPQQPPIKNQKKSHDYHSDRKVRKAR